MKLNIIITASIMGMTSVAHAGNVILFTKQDEAPKGGIQYYSVGCSDGSSGTTSETNIGRKNGKICVSGSQIKNSICKPKRKWSHVDAAKTICTANS